MSSSPLEIKDKGYRVWYQPEDHTVYFEGTLRLQPLGYAPIEELLQAALNQESGHIRLHLYDLQFLNSSGLNMLFKFVVGLRKKGNVGLSVKANKNVFWHAKALSNIERFFPAAEIELS